MRERLRNWIADADTRHSVKSFALSNSLPALAYQDGRLLDLYSSLVGELFDLLRAVDVPDRRDWASLGNGLALVGSQLRGRTQADAFFYSAASYYVGGWSASAYLTMKRANPRYWDVDTFRACYDLLARPPQVQSEIVAGLLAALEVGNPNQIDAARTLAGHAAVTALQVGPDEWVSARVLTALLGRFQRSNVRAVLPEGDSPRWTPLVRSLLERRPAVWDFFPSQIEAIEAGLLGTDRTYSLQMPTGAGKTALTETLIYDHLFDRPDEVAALLVPYRSLARELRTSLGTRLTQMGFATRTVYGGTVPTPEETQDLDSVRAVIATPEAMMGLLGSVPEFAERISLLVCDEGHLLDSEGRGVGLELLLARFRARAPSAPRMVFVSAVVPNIEEINAWLGGSDETVVRSDFRPAGAEYSVLRPRGGTGRELRLTLEMRTPEGTNLPTHGIPDFLSVSDFEYYNEPTKRNRTYKYDSYKTQAIAAARKSLRLGTVAVFTRPKRGTQGVIALAEELTDQLAVPLSLPTPAEFITDVDRLADIGAYLSTEYGEAWVGTTALAVGAVVHHGDIPQETRDAFEEILVAGNVRMVLCTSTLAEGVNLPIRTLVVYTTQIQTTEGVVVPMLAREIRNLVGRAGRAGSSTKGLVICVNSNQWDTIDQVAEGAPGEPVEGALLKDIGRLVRALALNNRALDNVILEGVSWLYPLVDGIDATLVELLRDDMGDDDFRRVAASLASSTYAWQRSEANERTALENVFVLRAERLGGLRTAGRVGWAAGTGVKVRLLDSIADSLAPAFDRWETVDDPADVELLRVLLAWAWRQPDFQAALRAAYPDKELVPPERLPDPADLLEQLRLWLTGSTFAQISTATTSDVNRLLRIHTGVLSYAFSTLVEQAVVVLDQLFAESELNLSPTIAMLPDYIRYGARSLSARNLMAEGVRHRRAANLLGADLAMGDPGNFFLTERDIARTLMQADPDRWRGDLGAFVYERTARDLGITLPQDD
jgi:helicase